MAHERAYRMNKRLSAVIVLVAVVTMVSIFTVVRARSARFVAPPFKQTAEAQETSRVATAEAGPHAPKPSLSSTTATEPPSCPWPGPQATYVGPLGPDTGPLPFFTHELNLTSKAVVAVGRAYYTVWLGASADDPGQGLIRVLDYSAIPALVMGWERQHHP